MSERLTQHHLQRKGFVYVRQSSQHQVARNQESRRLQYAMGHRLEQLGWTDIEVIDDDLGLSGSSTSQRTGFQRMVAAVCLGQVGAIAAREVSRFARNNRDWHQLLEMCRLVDTLLIDHEAIYDPRQANDRFLLGLKGSFSEYELDVLRQRSLEARYAKAQRGELVLSAPAGYIKTRDQRLEMDPDQRVQQAIRRVYKKFFELGSARQVLMWLIEHGLEVPTVHYGAEGWETCWRRPRYGSVWRILTEPTYAGAYAFGRSTVVSEVREGAVHKRQTRRPMEEWRVLIRDHHEGYIDWDDFQRIQRMLKDNGTGFRTQARGAAKKGAALLSGLLRCRRCGRKLMVSYTGTNSLAPRYYCHRGRLDNAEPGCISLGATLVDKAVSREVLRVVEPGATEAAILAASEQTTRHDDVIDSLLVELKAAQYATGRAEKQFDGVDPENRLVADELERRWNQALARVCELEQRLAQERSTKHAQTPTCGESLGDIAQDLHRVWNAPDTDVRLKKRIIRTLIEEIAIDVDREAHEVDIVIHWKGGLHSALRVPHRQRGSSRAHTAPDIVEAVRVLARVCDDTRIAAYLNRNNLRTGFGNRWTKERVTSLRSKRSIPCHSVERQAQAGWMTLNGAAQYLGISPRSLRVAAERGHVASQHPLSDCPWVFEKTTLDAPEARVHFAHLSKGCGAVAIPSNEQLPLINSST